jgi:predicted nucleic acid-binding protein
LILADTSIWVEFLKQTDFGGNQRFSECLDSLSVIAISAVFGELLQGVRNDKEEKVILEYWNALPKIDERNLFIEAGKISHEHKLYNKGIGLIDCYIIAAAQSNKLEIWSLDKKLLQASQLVNA